MSNEDIIQRFCESLRQLNLYKAAEVVEEVAKKLTELRDVTPSSLERLAELLKHEVSDEIDLIVIRSEIIKLNIPNISNCVADALKNIKPKSEELIKLRKLIEALINFYKYYYSDIKT